MGPYIPTLILHGGAGSISRQHLPPSLYAQYEASLSAYTAATYQRLRNGSSALDAACSAVCLMEDDELFNCGRGAVFTEAGTNELEASVMVASVDVSVEMKGSVKRGAGVSMVTGTRHPILLAREVLLQGDGGQRLGEMHCQRSGREVEEWGWKRGLERKDADWFWTRKRWEEHLRGLKEGEEEEVGEGEKDPMDVPSQGTVGAVCMDSWGTVAVATSTGGLTNKKPGRIGDTPTLGAGFWAESWEDKTAPDGRLRASYEREEWQLENSNSLWSLDISCLLGSLKVDCFPPPTSPLGGTPARGASPEYTYDPIPQMQFLDAEDARTRGSLNFTTKSHLHPRRSRRAVAMSGTGNGDSFLRTDAVRTAAAMYRFGQKSSLRDAVKAVAGPDGELQQSAGVRWGETGEGEGGIIGLEVIGGEKVGRIIAEFNCGGMWRCQIDEKTGKPKVMVFKEEYR